MQVTVRQHVGPELERQVLAIVNVALGVGRPDGRCVRLFDALIEHVINIVECLDGIADRVQVRHPDQSVTVIPFKLRRLARSGDRFLGTVAFVVVNVGVRTVVEQSVVRTGRVAGHRPIAVGVVSIRFVGLVIMIGGGQLARRVIGVIARPVLVDQPTPFPH